MDGHFYVWGKGTWMYLYMRHKWNSPVIKSTLKFSRTLLWHLWLSDFWSKRGCASSFRTSAGCLSLSSRPWLCSTTQDWSFHCSPCTLELHTIPVPLIVQKAPEIFVAKIVISTQRVNSLPRKLCWKRSISEASQENNKNRPSHFNP